MNAQKKVKNLFLKLIIIGFFLLLFEVKADSNFFSKGGTITFVNNNNRIKINICRFKKIGILILFLFPLYSVSRSFGMEYMMLLSGLPVIWIVYRKKMNMKSDIMDYY